MPTRPPRLNRSTRTARGRDVLAGVVVVVAAAGCFRASNRPPPRPENLVAPPNSGNLRGEEGFIEPPPPPFEEPPPPPPPPVEGTFPDLDPDDGVPATSCALPADDSGTVEVVAADAAATEIVADADGVYWLAVHDDGDGDLVRLVDGAAPEIVAAAGAHPVGLRLAAGAVFWGEDVEGGRVLAWFGADPVVLADGQSEPRAVDSNGDDVCWGGSGTLRCTHLGAAVDPVRVFEGLHTISDVRVLGDGYVYWADRSVNGRVNRAPVVAGVREVMLIDVGPPDAVRFDHGEAFVRTGSVLYRLADGGATIDGVTGSARQFTLDADTIYWTGIDDGVHRRGRDGTDLDVIIAESTAPNAIAVDACWVYWTDTVDGAVRRVRK